MPTRSFSLKVSGQLDTGRLFVAQNYETREAQSLIVADSEKTQVAAKAAASWTEAGAVPSTVPTTPGGAQSGGGDLANTGADQFRDAARECAAQCDSDVRRARNICLQPACWDSSGRRSADVIRHVRSG